MLQQSRTTRYKYRQQIEQITDRIDKKHGFCVSQQFKTDYTQTRRRSTSVTLPSHVVKNSTLLTSKKKPNGGDRDAGCNARHAFAFVPPARSHCDPLQLTKPALVT